MTKQTLTNKATGEEWEESSGCFRIDEECRVFRKVKKPEPMPAIQPGDLVRFDCTNWIVFAVGTLPNCGGYDLHIASMEDGHTNHWYLYQFEKLGESIHRDGKKIWQRD